MFPNADVMTKSLRLAWISRLLAIDDKRNEVWKTIPNHFFDMYGGLNFLLRCNYDSKFLGRTGIPQFYNLMLQFFLKLKSSHESDLGQDFVNDKQTYQELKRDPTPALQRKVNNKLLTLNKLNAIDTRRYYRLRCSVPQAPKLYGVPKLHKPNTPMRPIVSHCGSPTYQLSKYLTTILQPLTNESRHKVQSTKDFIDTIKTVQIPNDHKLVSFDVTSLFTSIPVQLALDYSETAMKNSIHELPLPKDDIMDLLKLCLTCSFFQYNGKHYKQLHGTAMGSPVSGVVAEIVMQNIEQQALATYKETLWLRYVDETFTAVHKDEINFLHEHLNKQNTYIQFTREIEENGKIPFLDCLLSRGNNKLRTTIYRKLTNTDRLLDQCFLSPHLSQSDCCTDPNKTSTSSLRLTQDSIERNQTLTRRLSSQEQLQPRLYLP